RAREGLLCIPYERVGCGGERQVAPLGQLLEQIARILVGRHPCRIKHVQNEKAVRSRHGRVCVTIAGPDHGSTVTFDPSAAAVDLEIEHAAGGQYDLKERVLMGLHECRVAPEAGLEGNLRDHGFEQTRSRRCWCGVASYGRTRVFSKRRMAGIASAGV